MKQSQTGEYLINFIIEHSLFRVDGDITIWSANAPEQLGAAVSTLRSHKLTAANGEIERLLRCNEQLSLTHAEIINHANAEIKRLRQRDVIEAPVHVPLGCFCSHCRAIAAETELGEASAEIERLQRQCDQLSELVDVERRGEVR